MLLSKGLRLAVMACVSAALAFALTHGAVAQSGEPIKIGFGMSLTGGLAPNGKSALVAMKIWEEDTNAKGGLLGRPVKLVYYDDQSTPATVPGLYTKLLDVDKCELIIGGYATNMLAPAMPVVMQRNMVFIGLFGLAVNTEFKYDKYFAMIPTGPDAKPAMSKAFFDVAMAQKDKPKTIAIVAADAEFARNAADGARTNAKAAGLQIVYDKTYPPATTDYTPIVRAIQATNPDMVFVGSYPPDSVGMVRAANEVGLKTKIFGGGMVGLQATVFKTQLGPLLNGIVNYDFWIPAKTMQFQGALDLLKKYQERAKAEGVDPLGYYMAPWAYADLQILGQAVAETKSLDQDKLGDYIRKTTFKTVIGDVSFGKNGEWAKSRMLAVQFQNVKSNDIGQFKDLSTEVILAPAEYKTGDAVYPYTEAKK